MENHERGKLSAAFDGIAPEYISAARVPPKKSRAKIVVLLAAAAAAVLLVSILVPLLTRTDAPSREDFSTYIWSPEELDLSFDRSEGFSITSAVFTGTRSAAIDVSANADGTLVVFADLVSPGKYALTFRGEGEMCDFNKEKGLFYDAVIVSARFEDGITSIGAYAFYGQRELSSLSLPKSLERIEKYAFAYCTALKSVSLPPQVKAVETLAFAKSGCVDFKVNSAVSFGDGALSTTPLQKISFPDGCVFEDAALEFCVDLCDVTLPADLEILPAGMFKYCSSLRNIELPAGLKSIWGGAFAGCSSLEKIVIPASVETVYYTAFDGSNFLRVTFEDPSKNIFSTLGIESWDEKTGTMTISGNAWNSQFQNFAELRTLIVGEGVRWIGGYAFFGCGNLEKVVIGQDCLNIAQSAFSACPNLNEVVVDPGNSVYHSVDGCLVQTSSGILCTVTKSGEIPKDSSVKKLGQAFAYSDIESVEIPPNIQSICNMAFSDCEKLARIVIPETVREIESYAFARSSIAEIVLSSPWTVLASSAFSGCASLTKVLLPEGMTELPGTLFANDKALVEILLPSTVRKIGGCAFARCTSLSCINLENVNEIEGFAFENCTSLAEVYLPSLKVLEPGIFRCCTGLRRVAFSSALQQFNVTEQSNHFMARNPFAECQDLEIVFEDENPRFRFEDGCFIDIERKLLVAGFGNFTIPDDGSVTAISRWAAAGNTELTSIVIPASITKMGGECFSGCTALKSARIDSAELLNSSDAYTKREGAVFCDCPALERVFITHGAKIIPLDCFSGCKSLTEIWLPSSLKTIASGAFAGCRALTTVHFEGTEEEWSALRENTSADQHYLYAAHVEYEAKENRDV